MVDAGDCRLVAGVAEWQLASSDLSLSEEINDGNKMCFLETIAAYELESVPIMPSLCRQIYASPRLVIRSALGIA